MKRNWKRVFTLALVGTLLVSVVLYGALPRTTVRWANNDLQLHALWLSTTGMLYIGGLPVTSTAERLNSADALLATTALVNVGSVAATTLYTVPAGKSCVITKVIVRNASGTFDQATDPVLSFGWNSTNFNNVITSATYTNAMAAAANYFILVPTGASNATVSTAGAAAGTFKINVTTAATAATTCTISVFGYLF